ncbi:MAG: beta-hydroxyacyl-ACP dehydratase [Phycisphaeraceae bacterium]|nr:beta-hydroxyacyl-ACP dehydratase [Phycisphaerae bacterium]MBX3392192.1 beta-hydroxyacyl-ACP dehydratase [Phycisphaeraceae bacterium]
MLPRPSESASLDQPRNAAVETTDSSHEPLFDLSGIDLATRIHGRDRVEQFIPHRGAMSLVDHIIWEHPSRLQGVACKVVGDSEFWVPGHFPQQPLFPGVMMIETAAQFAAYLFKSRVSPGPSLVVFLRIDDVSFRHMVRPGDSLYILCNEIKVGKRRFTSASQGIVSGKIAFQGTLTGMIR